MRMQSNTIILTCLLLLPVVFGNLEKNETTFVPTREWQTVKKGTPIPAGLHVRHNFESGVTEAKLIDDNNVKEEDSNKSSNSTNTNSVMLHPENTILEEKDHVPAEKSDLFNYSIEELKDRLKKMKQDGEDFPEIDIEHSKKIRQKFRDYEALKKEFKSFEINITVSDSDLLSSYIKKFQAYKNKVTMGILTTAEIERILDILYNLEYLLHHIDNAKVFADMEGMNKIISPCLNGTNNEIKIEALRLLGAAVQSNPKVQLKALENDLVQKLLHILSTSSKSDLKSRCLFALGALIRQFPIAQKVWVDHGGVEIFGQILVDGQLQVQMKVMKLINDLIVERQHIEYITDVAQQELRVKAYSAADIERKLLKYSYCDRLSNLMITSFKIDLSDLLRTNYEFLKTISDSMITAAPICIDKWRKHKDEFLPIIQHILDLHHDLNILIGMLQTLETTHDEL
ncbi:sil1 nucleotide exchange factor [Bombus vancouverensis nearcticus]|uniref:Nucleotide exchange factor SIL1 n=1 Tax=Bombus bifarius TaxID=103933 RepID=A0A6P8M932_9HYME|nr:nucleotide exchange factor Sil1 [Bombus vancouverensis nearcticus]XP_033310251.1 nucleotide exchange factor Sil1 [Bombus bifarius]